MGYRSRSAYLEPDPGPGRGCSSLGGLVEAVEAVVAAVVWVARGSRELQWKDGKGGVSGAA